MILFSSLSCASSKQLVDTELQIVNEKFKEAENGCTYLVTLQKVDEGVPYEFTISSTQPTCEEAKLDAAKTIEKMKQDVDTP